VIKKFFAWLWATFLNIVTSGFFRSWVAANARIIVATIVPILIHLKVVPPSQAAWATSAGLLVIAWLLQNLDPVAVKGKMAEIADNPTGPLAQAASRPIIPQPSSRPLG